MERAKRNGKPLVALESALITHGIPWPENLTIARAMEDAVKHNGAFPATVAVQEGQLRVGLSSSQLESLAESRDPHKLSLRDLGAAVARKWNGGTTVSATLYAAERAGIKVLATGGIGGVHRAPAYDISADLLQLRKVRSWWCALAPKPFDLPATLEVLETWASRSSATKRMNSRHFTLPKADSRCHCALRAPGSGGNRPCALEAHVQHERPGGGAATRRERLPPERMEALVAQALQQAEAEGVRGSALHHTCWLS